jgi:hypothetical protein
MPGKVSIWDMTEAELLAEVVSLCEQRGIWWVHIDTPYRNRKRQNLIGFPDLFLCGTRGIMFAELKKQRGWTSSPEQTSWKHQLRGAGQRWELWQPRDLESGRIERALDMLCT